MQRAIFSVILLVTVAHLGACATVTRGSSQTVTVSTVPSGAVCELRRGGELIGAVNPTPGSIVVSKSGDHISVVCVKEDYESMGGSLSSSFAGMTFGNILLGGFIGLGVDAASGAMHQYPASIQLTLPPSEFPSAQSRDAFYANLKHEVEREAEQAIATVRAQCGPNEQAQCERAIQKIADQRDDGLDELEAKRATARVRTE